MKNGWRRLLFSVWLWALAPTLFVSWVIPGIGERYAVNIEHLSIGEDSQVAFWDLNGDGITERIHGQAGIPLNGFPIMDNDLNFYDQWNLPDKLQTGISELSFGNFDDDKFGEIYVFTLQGDSIFLNVNEFFDPAGILLERAFITRISLVEGHPNSTLRPIGFFDNNGDGIKEFYFGITTGFGLWPRLCYYYDLKNRELASQPKTGINFNTPDFSDIDGDNHPEIVSDMTASGNHNIPTPFTDYSAWLMVLDDNLEIKFPPAEFPGFGGALQVRAVRAADKTPVLAVAYNYQGAEKQIKDAGIYIFNHRGGELRSLSFASLRVDGHVWLETINHSQHPILMMSNELIALGENLEVRRRVTNPVGRLDSYFLLDIDHNGIDEIFINNHLSQRTAVLNNDLQLLATIPLQLWGDNVRHSLITLGTGQQKAFIRAGTKGYFLEFTRNQYYQAGFLIYPGVYLAFVLFISVIRKVNTKQVEKRESQKRRLLTLQLQSVKSQLDPHFTFNALNSVASLLYLEDRKMAYDALNKFTRLLRQMLNDADKVYRTLEEELQFVTGYLELEKVRFGNKFNYEISIGDGVTKKELVPKMVLQTFAENAVKHGLVPKGGGGMLRIQIKKERDFLKVVVEDNGVGRHGSTGIDGGTGKGLKMTQEFYELLNQVNKQPSSFDISDLNPGTTVSIVLPLDPATSPIDAIV